MQENSIMHTINNCNKWKCSAWPVLWVARDFGALGHGPFMTLGNYFISGWGAFFAIFGGVWLWVPFFSLGVFLVIFNWVGCIFSHFLWGGEHFWWGRAGRIFHDFWWGGALFWIFLWGGAHFWSIFGGAGRKILPEKFRLGRNFHAFHIGPWRKCARPVKQAFMRIKHHHAQLAHCFFFKP